MAKGKKPKESKGRQVVPVARVPSLPVWEREIRSAVRPLVARVSLPMAEPVERGALVANA